jgi:hypothetical protein
MTRFEKYVHDTISDGVKERREELVMAYEEARADAKAKKELLEDVAEKVASEAARKAEALAKKWGWTRTRRNDVVSFVLHDEAFEETQGRFLDRPDGRSEYVMNAAADQWRALVDFEEKVQRAANRLVVVKKDLGMKAEEFDKAVADAIAKLLK